MEDRATVSLGERPRQSDKMRIVAPKYTMGERQ
jgi:hypothetical protein